MREPPTAWRFRAFLLLIVALVLLLGWAGIRLQAAARLVPPNSTPLDLAATPLFTDTPNPTLTQPPRATLTSAPTRQAQLGTYFFAGRQEGYTHLWAYVPGDAAPVRLTNGPWNDRDPALSPDLSQVAFASDRGGPWDLYLLVIRTGEIRRLTETMGYEGHPTWSPDGRWLSFEAYYDGDFDLWILPVDGSQPPIQLTNHPGLDLSPAWDPLGRRIAFVSDRAGLPDVFLADLDRADDRFTNLTQSGDYAESWPVFSRDGSALAYSVSIDGIDQVMLQDLESPERQPSTVGQGRSPAWLQNDDALFALLPGANRPRVVTYSLDPVNGHSLSMPNLPQVSSLLWSSAGLPGEAFTNGLLMPTSDPLYRQDEIAVVSDSVRKRLIRLPGVSSPNPVLSETVAGPFQALRRRVQEAAGWDFLGVLDYAFMGLNDPLPPGYAYNDWLYTGRAFAISDAAVRAGWVEAVREDLAGQTYWRIYLRTELQDGSLGEPLRVRPWDFSARYGGDPSAYDQGGAPRDHMPQGFYVDFTSLAADYGFQRLPALANWRTYYPGARFGEFARMDGLNWEAAMLELYPPSAIRTPTPYRTPTPTPTITPSPTPTPWWWRWRTPTPSPTFAPPATPTATP